jgi:hypothetical protein
LEVASIPHVKKQLVDFVLMMSLVMGKNISVGAHGEVFFQSARNRRLQLEMIFVTSEV